MRVVLAKWGNSAAVRLPKAVLEALHLKPGAVLSLDFDPASIRFRLVPERKGRKLEDMAEAARQIGVQNEPDMVDWGADIGAEIIADRPLP